METVILAAGAVVIALVAVGVASNLYHRRVTAIILRDTERTVRAVRDLPPDYQKEIATASRTKYVL